MQTSESDSPPNNAQLQRMPYFQQNGVNVRCYVYPYDFKEESHPQAATNQFHYIQNQRNMQFRSNLSGSNEYVTD